MAEEVKFKCLRCGCEYRGMYDRRDPEERKCPKCGSNSMRPLRKEKD